MSEFVKLSPEERNLYCRQASERMSVSLPPAFIEKDFWVCWILNILNNLDELNGNITFKGGTSLSKAFGLIERFSEDIDIAINRKVFGQQPPLGAEDATSNRQRKLRIEELEIKSAEYIREKLIPILDREIKSKINDEPFTLKAIQKGNEVNIEFEYPGTLKNELGGLLPIVLIELVPRADEIPNEQRKITPIIHEIYSDLLGEFSFNVASLAPERTFLEKLFFIHETIGGFNKGSERKSRHYYDLFKLYNAGTFEKIKNNPKLLEIVVEHRKTFFRYNKMDYEIILKDGVKIIPTKESLSEWRGDYSRSSAMIYGFTPEFNQLMDFVKSFELEFNNWISNK
jgi:predicted nucleotidyltransferase component of viral defense system